MKNDKIKELKDNEIAQVTGGMKVIVEEPETEEESWWQTLVNFFFDVKS